ncbi:hypothetical protein SASPL_146848 [Salvia splendens]|uniref:Serine aminopeptidase S33 domain-containing protein n=1 Tax=Salvia splendens TaxID=180675 RepID=A0A8X8Z663_SALSN|nr:hypothetical protein SASPL_146848 [Salvia splendens]
MVFNYANPNLSSPLLYSLFPLPSSRNFHSLLFLYISSGFSSVYEIEVKPKISPTRRKTERAVKAMGKAVKFEGVTEELQKILDADMDQVGPRRRAREAFKHIQLSIDHILFKDSAVCYTPKDENALCLTVWFRWLEINLNCVVSLAGNEYAMRQVEDDRESSNAPFCYKQPRVASYDVNSRGLEIFSKSWVPNSWSPKAVVCYCHGYGDTCTFFFEGMWLIRYLGIARKLASSGYAVFAMDYPGFGLSEGLHGYIPKFDLIVDDVIEQYSKVKGTIPIHSVARYDNFYNLYSERCPWMPKLDACACCFVAKKVSDAENPEFRLLPSFLFGQSMGGAVALKVHLKQADAWNGAVLAAPMCKLADEMVPPWPLDQILIGLAKLFPKQKLVPQKDLAELAFKDVKKRQQTAYNVVAYKHKPRLRTAVELLRTTQEIEQQLEKVSLPLLILHGKDDKVTDPSVSNALYERAQSHDKTLNLYDHSFHSLLEGEPDDIILKVFNDIIYWLDKHC